MGRKVLDSLDLMLRQQDAAKPGQVKPLIGGAFDATEVEVERVNVHVGSHWHVLKKQEPPPKERLRALLVKQSGVMMTKFLPVAWAVVKSRLIVRILLFRFKGRILGFVIHAIGGQMLRRRPGSVEICVGSWILASFIPIYPSISA